MFNTTLNTKFIKYLRNGFHGFTRGSNSYTLLESNYGFDNIFSVQLLLAFICNMYSFSITDVSLKFKRTPYCGGLLEVEFIVTNNYYNGNMFIYTFLWFFFIELSVVSMLRNFRII